MRTRILFTRSGNGNGIRRTKFSRQMIVISVFAVYFSNCGYTFLSLCVFSLSLLFSSFFSVFFFRSLVCLLARLRTYFMLIRLVNYAALRTKSLGFSLHRSRLMQRLLSALIYRHQIKIQSHLLALISAVNCESC